MALQEDAREDTEHVLEALVDVGPATQLKEAERREARDKGGLLVRPREKSPKTAGLPRELAQRVRVEENKAIVRTVDLDHFSGRYPLLTTDLIWLAGST